MLAIVTYFWTDRQRDADRGYNFSDEIVRIWKAQVDTNCSIPHKTICVTDHEIEGVETFPLDWQKYVPGTVFLRLMQHNPEIGRQFGTRILSLDLDIAITRNIDHIVNRPEPAVWWRNPNFPKSARSFYQGSVQLFTPGATQSLWSDFNPVETLKWVNWRFGGFEQAWLGEHLSWDQPYFSDADGIYGAGRLTASGSGQGVHTALPDNACIVSFPGRRAPWQRHAQTAHPWVAEYWPVLE